jgi:hypothetical protein
VTLEERKYIRDKIRAAYQRKAPSYEELLEACCAIEEEYVYIMAPSRLDYFKSGVQYEKRVAEKLSALRSGVPHEHALSVSTRNGTSTDDLTSAAAPALKRVKTQH